MAVKTSALSSTVRPFRPRASRGAAATSRSRVRFPHNYLSVLDLDAAAFTQVLDLAVRLKAERKLGRRAPTAQALAGRHVALLFDKPSLRTRATFEIAVHELGGDVIVPPQDGPLGARETVPPNNEMQRTKHGPKGASPLISVFSVPTAMNVEVERAPLTAGASSGQQHWGASVEGCSSVLVERASSRPVAAALSV